MPDTLQIQPCSRQAAAIVVAGERVTIKATPGFEARISRSLPSLNASEERFESLVYPAQDILTRREIGQLAGPSSPDRLELIRLIVVSKGGPSHAVGIAAFLQRRIVQATGFAQLCCKCRG